MNMDQDQAPNVVELSKAKKKRGSGSGEPTSDAALARAFIDECGHKLRYDPVAEKWSIFDGKIWRQDRTGTASAMLLEGLAKSGIGSAKKVRDARALSQLDARIIAPTELWNADPFLIGTPAGVLNLRAGTMLPPSPKHMVSLCTSIAPEFEPPSTWLTFLQEATRGNAAYVRYLQQLCGYLLTGSVHVEGFWFIYGDGGGGKGTFIDTFAACLGEYGWKAASRTILASKSERHLSEIMALRGRRMVYISETPSGREWDIARLKELTGGDPINANAMRSDGVNFLPTHKLIAMGNHAPSVPQIDNSIRRRFHILPFDNIVPESRRDDTLKTRLKAELPRILAWAIEGARDMLANGLVIPEIVREASEAYFSDEDGFTDWLSEKCDQGEQHDESSTSLLTSWNGFRKGRGEDTENHKTFAERLRRAGFIGFKRSHARWRGLQLNSLSSASPSKHWERS